MSHCAIKITEVRTFSLSHFPPCHLCQQPQHFVTSDLCSLINGVGELNLSSDDQKLREEALMSPGAVDTPYPECPYLLLDVREREQYEHCHIISGRWLSLSLRSDSKRKKYQVK